MKATIDSGVLVGEAQNGVQYFRGVPYAKAPVGELRWKPPQKPDPWPGERTALRFEPACPQPTALDGKSANQGGVWGTTSEDCLYLQVFAPAAADKAPVMVWLHGGGFFLGAGHLGSYDGTANAKQGVVTIAANYRLGALGFFAHKALTGEAKASEWLGAYALMDAIEALKWARRNAAAFGGDANNITVAGQSAGGILVLNLLTTPAAKGLFNKAIVQSGSLLLPAPSLAEAEAQGAESATKLGLPGADATAAHLRAVSGQTLVSRAFTFRPQDIAVDGRLRVLSTIAALEAGEEHDVPLLIGANSAERMFSAARKIAGLAGKDGTPAFLYQFGYVPEFRKKEWTKGAIHSAELAFTFDSLATSSWGGPGVDDDDRAFAKRVNSCWVAFMKAPADATKLSCADGFDWPAYTSAGDRAAVFDRAITVKTAGEIPDGTVGPGS